jgi:hypothetical protein
MKLEKTLIKKKKKIVSTRLSCQAHNPSHKIETPQWKVNQMLKDIKPR